MTERVKRDIVVMTQPFALTGIDRMLPPGRYVVETTEESIDSLSFPAYRRVSTTLALPAIEDFSCGVRQIVEIDPAELEPLVEIK